MRVLTTGAGKMVAAFAKYFPGDLIKVATSPRAPGASAQLPFAARWCRKENYSLAVRDCVHALHVLYGKSFPVAFPAASKPAHFRASVQSTLAVFDSIKVRSFQCPKPARFALKFIFSMKISEDRA
jgi:hypothetical protein